MEKERFVVGGDYLSLKEIARAWSKVAGDKPEMLMGGLVSGFWLGEFEGDGQSALFALLQPVSANCERQPGKYATRGNDTVVKVGEDLRSYATAERTVAPVFREAVAYVHCRPEWRGITAEHPAGFEEWTDEERDGARPSWRTEYEESYLGLSTLSYEQWPSDLREDHFSRWHIRRHYFAHWYQASPLSAGAPLERFWPHTAEKKVALFTGPPPTAKAKTDCLNWLRQIMKESPNQRLKTKDVLFAEASKRYGRLSRRGFDEAWKQAVEDLRAFAWLKGGAPKKSLQ